MYGGSHVVNLFKQEVVSQKNNRFATVTLHNNLFCHRLCPCPSSLHKSTINIGIEERYMPTLSLRSKGTSFRTNALNEISRNNNLNRTT